APRVALARCQGFERRQQGFVSASGFQRRLAIKKRSARPNSGCERRGARASSLALVLVLQAFYRDELCHGTRHIRASTRSCDPDRLPRFLVPLRSRWRAAAMPPALTVRRQPTGAIWVAPVYRGPVRPAQAPAVPPALRAPALAVPQRPVTRLRGLPARPEALPQASAARLPPVQAAEPPPALAAALRPAAREW